MTAPASSVRSRFAGVSTLNAPQESGCAAAVPRATIVSMRVVLLVLSLLLFVAAVAAMPVPADVQPGRTTVVVVTDRPLPAGQWTALQAALRANLPTALSESASIDPAPQILRGDQITGGMVVDRLLSVRLLGNCVPRVNPWRIHMPGALGWVVRREGRIDPFIYVDCDALVHMLGPAFFGRDHRQQVDLLSRSIARVMLHEWVHIANQSGRHGGKGIEKAQFSLRDLLADSSIQSVAQLQPPRPSSAVQDAR